MKHSVLCEKHFAEDSFEADSPIASSMRIAKCKRLRHNVIPTIFERPRLPTETSAARSRKRVGSSAAPGASTSTGLLVKNTRKAYEKRERSRVR